MENNNFTVLYNELDKQVLKTAEDSLNPESDRFSTVNPRLPSLP